MRTENELLFVPRSVRKDVWFPAEIKKENESQVTLEDYNDALLVDDLFIVAYKFIAGRDKIFIGRERTIPVKPIYTRQEVMWPYPDEKLLKGSYGVLMFDFTDDELNSMGIPQALAVEQRYEITLDRIYEEDDLRLADINIFSVEPIEYEFIEGGLSYNRYLKRRHTGS
ncbi:MAG: hypothetical protein A3B38_04370 [Candidatus Levybacteria bacterium RIFCSPLOWO2_01_FULL_36_13]|nr:MAG: hypothetical protein A2684_00115 [Candidatus Levybacteria bacterium RIFCSPHIGHO2_01_FULL_36_15b]OGH34064.1 MAG: hypothetical protein A3B38_04370 [Candidatus Levybacteria bacterium RIFCSPLOWO2_01_FULL_36_13]